jgi:hypothetical protein
MNQIRNSVDELYYTQVFVFGIISLAWFALACFLIGLRKPIVSEAVAIEPGGHDSGSTGIRVGQPDRIC